MGKKITLNQKKEIIEYYKKQPITIEKISKIFQISQPTMGKILKEFRIKPYTKTQLFSPELQENYFKNIDTEAKAYFLGLIIADGCIHYSSHNSEPMLCLTMQTKDKYILEEFKRQIKSNKIITYDKRGCYNIQIISTQIVNDLKKYGVTPRKGLTIEFPKNISDIMMPHFIRGLIDGDGSISFYSRPNRNTHTKAIRMCKGNKQFLIDFTNYLHKSLNIPTVSIYQEKENLWSVAYRQVNVLYKLIHYLYDDATIYLMRKYNICNQILTEINQYNDNTEVTI